MKKIVLMLVMAISLASCNSIETNKTEDVTAENAQIIETTTEASQEEVNKMEAEVAEKLNITTSIIPLASITNYIGGDLVSATSLVPSGVSPHGFDVKPNQMVDIEKSDLIVFLGLDHVDGFLDKAVEGKDNVLAVKTGIELLESSGEHDEHKDEDNHEEEGHDEHSTDPHIWGSADNAYIIAKSILDQLVVLSPENKDVFEKNLSEFRAELDAVKKDFEEKTLDKKQSNFIVFHDAYNYLFDEHKIEEANKHVFRTNMLSDPNSADMKTLIDEIKEEGIKVAFKETQLDASSLQKTASEHGLGIFVLNPLGESEAKDGYIQNYRNNLESLQNIYE